MTSEKDGKPIEGHHMEDVKNHPESADDTSNIDLRSFTEHRKKDSGIHSKYPKKHEISPNTRP